MLEACREDAASSPPRRVVVGVDPPASVGGEPGDLLLVNPGPAQVHLLVFAGTRGFIHAHAGLGRVVRTPAPCPWSIAIIWRLAAD